MAALLAGLEAQTRVAVLTMRGSLCPVTRGPCTHPTPHTRAFLPWADCMGCGCSAVCGLRVPKKLPLLPHPGHVTINMAQLWKLYSMRVTESVTNI